MQLASYITPWTLASSSPTSARKAEDAVAQMALQTLLAATLLLAIAVATASPSLTDVRSPADPAAVQPTEVIQPFDSFAKISPRKRRYFRFRRKCGPAAKRFRTLDGSCNNKRRIKLGSAETTFFLKVPRHGTAPSGQERPNPRTIRTRYAMIRIRRRTAAA